MTKKPLKAASLLAAILLIVGMAAACSAPASGSGADSSAAAAAGNGNYSDTITIVWYPNESSSDFEEARKHYEDLVAQATGKKVVDKPTTDYNIAVEALANGTAQIGAVMGALGYIQAQQESADVKALAVNTGSSGTLDDAVYYSRFCVPKGQEQNYMTNGEYTLDNIQGKKMSFVSNSSTSGFLFPTTTIVSYFSKMDQWKSLTADDLTEGGADKFFSQVDFGGSHQGSAVNLLSGKDDVAAFDDGDLAEYVNAVSGDVKTAGSVFEVKAGAAAPFDTVVGKQFVIIKAMPVQNGPFAYNSKTLSPDDAKKIQDLMTSDSFNKDPLVFAPEGSFGLLEQSGSSHFVAIDDAWYDPIRDMLK